METALELKGKKDFLLAASLLNADQLALGKDLKILRSEIDWVHVDVMDGHFVPNLSFGPSLVKAVRKDFPNVFIDVHVMAEPAENYVGMFAGAGCDLLIVHAEATRHIHRVLESIRRAGVRAGVSLNPGTPVSMLESVLPMVDFVLVMTVNPGFGAQKFMPEVVSKFKSLVRFRIVHSLDYLIGADGGVNDENASLLVKSGCDVLVVGSALFNGRDPVGVAIRMRKNVGKRTI
jgi:ribulose-phosphate 3-epimerase